VRGPCPYVGGLAAALVSLFVAQNLPVPLSTTHIGVDLKPPQVQLTPGQQFFAGGHLAGLAEFATARDCRLSLKWDYDTNRGSRTIGA
jgi:hypothetical protein